MSPIARVLGLGLWCSATSACWREAIELLPGYDAGATSSDVCSDQGSARGGQVEILLLLDSSASTFLPVATDCVLTLRTDCPVATQTYWDVTAREIQTFVDDPDSAQIALGLRYFGEACGPEAYLQPNVPPAVLPDNAAAIQQSLRTTLPFSQTATTPALLGALAYMRSRARVGLRSAIVLLTDDDPETEDCNNNSVENLAAAAATGQSAAPEVATYVVVTSTYANLGSVAQAGGTERALRAELARPGSLSSILGAIRDRERTLACGL